MSPTARDARSAAAGWVATTGARLPGFAGAYLAGSVLDLAPGRPLPVGSDVDVNVVVDSGTADAWPPKLGKVDLDDVLLDVTLVPAGALADADAVLSAYHLAGPFARKAILTDPTGQLEALRRRVSAHFTDDTWVRRRVADAMQRIRAGLAAVGTAPTWPEQVTQWLFATSVTTHVVLVAALRNPTTRTRYVAAREVLHGHGLDDVYTELLDLLGARDLTPAQVERHVVALAATFDATAEVARTPYFFSTDLTPRSRPIVVDGSAELVRRGDHREAMFWVVATFARCHTVLQHDDPSLQRALAPDFAAALDDLGVRDRADLDRRGAAVTAYLPRLSEVAERVLGDRRSAG